jgi:phosphoglycolate phosphatase
MPAMAPARLLILDFDGTLADSFPWFLGALDEVARVFGFRAPSHAEAEALRGQGTRAILAALGVPMWKLPAMAGHVRRMAAEAPPPPLFPGIAEALDGLAARGTALAVASSNTEAQVRRTLGPALAAHIGHYACEASLFGKAARFRRLLREARIPAAEAMSVGDELRDIAAAREAGIAAGAVAWGYADPAALRAAGPDAFFETPAELLRPRRG